MRKFVQFLRIGSLRKNFNHKLKGFVLVQRELENPVV